MNPQNQNQATAHPKPWTVFAGTAIHDANGQVVLAAYEESEGCGGTFEGIRQAIADSVQSVNERECLLAIAEAAKNCLAYMEADSDDEQEQIDYKATTDALTALATLREKGAA